MALFPYNLPDVAALAGTFKFTLYSDIVDLIVPTKQTILSIGKKEETVEWDIGSSELSTLELDLSDDYSMYSSGFWYKVLNGEMRLRIYLVEGGTNKFYFFGTPQDITVDFTEHALVANTYLRTGKLTLVSMGSAIYDTLTSDWIANLLLKETYNTPAVDGIIREGIGLRGFFAAFLKASGLNTGQALNDVSLVFDPANPDFKWNTTKTIDDIRIPLKFYQASPPGTVSTNYFDSTNAWYLPNHYATVRELIKTVLKNFGLMMRMDYDVGTEIFKLELLQYGRAYSGTLDFSGREKQSRIQKSSILLGDAARFAQLIEDPLGTVYQVWFSKKYLGNSIFSTNVPGDFVDFDIDNKTLFSIYSGGYGYGSRLHVYNPASYPDLVTAVSYYNYRDKNYVAASAADPRLMEEACAGYYYYRFSSVFTRIVRLYGRITANAGSGETFTSLNIMRRTQINDGLTSLLYYANTVTIDPNESEVEIEWIRE